MNEQYSCPYCGSTERKEKLNSYPLTMAGNELIISCDGCDRTLGAGVLYNPPEWEGDKMTEQRKIIINADHHVPGHVVITEEDWYAILELLAEGGADVQHFYEQEN